jgi:hypothetical protein
MATLDRWRNLLQTPRTLTFPRMSLIALDHGPPIIEGSGLVQMDSPNEFRFTLKGLPNDFAYASSELNRHRLDPYDTILRSRLIGTDDQGIEWNGGYTNPNVDARNHEWTLTGDLSALSTLDSSNSVSQSISTEVIYLLRVGDPMTVAFARYIRADAPSGHVIREKQIELLGSKIKFLYESEDSIVSVVATNCEDFPSLFAENWLGEPLRILFGQLIYPRLAARNLGNGRAHIALRRSPGLFRESGGAALWPRFDESESNDSFWSCYARLLDLVAKERNADGTPNFESNKLTRLYEEVIQASRGSRRVWALTFAVTIEALVKMLIPKYFEPTTEETAAIEAMTFHIAKWPGDVGLKKIATEAVRRTAQMTTARAMRELQKKAVITKEQVTTWNDIRNSVVHGSLLSPYSNRKEDEQLLKLAAMMHALTRERLRHPEHKQ